MSINQFTQLVNTFIELETTPDWHKQAECRGMDPELFYPEKGGIREFVLARQVCDICPVALQCLQFAIKHGEHFGVWGGTNSKGRRPRSAARSLAALRERQEAFRDRDTIEINVKRPNRLRK